MWEDEVMDVVAIAEGSGIWKGIVVGGCCKTTPEHIAGLRGRIDGFRADSETRS